MLHEIVSIAKTEQEPTPELESHTLLRRHLYPQQLTYFLSVLKEEGIDVSNAQYDAEYAWNLSQSHSPNDVLGDEVQERVRNSLAGQDTFLIDTYRARTSGRVALEENLYVFTPEQQTHVDNLLAELREAEIGIEFPASFIDRLADPNTHVVVISLDLNSTFNQRESYPESQLLVGRAHSELIRFRNNFRACFPDKKLVIAANTGRPGLYAWGFIEASFPPISETRQIAVAESGGTIISDIETGSMQPAVDNPLEWRAELDALAQHISRRIANPSNIHIEPKLSMLSLRLAESDNWILQTPDGVPIDPAFIEDQVQQFFSESQQTLDAELEELIRDIEVEMPGAYAYTVKAINEKLNGNGHNGSNGYKDEALRELTEMYVDLTAHAQARIATIRARLQTLHLMHDQHKLVVNYNSTAGYVDIGHADLNKYSTLSRYVRKQYQCDNDNVLYVHIGDSSTDILPINQTGAGEINEGADDAYLVCVADSNQKLLAANEKRGNNGLVTRRPSILGATDMFCGLTTAVMRANSSQYITK